MVPNSRALVAIVKPARRVLADLLSLAAILVGLIIVPYLIAVACSPHPALAVEATPVPALRLIATADEGKVLIFEMQGCLVAVTHVYGGRTVSTACR